MAAAADAPISVAVFDASATTSRPCWIVVVVTGRNTSAYEHGIEGVYLDHAYALRRLSEVGCANEEPGGSRVDLIETTVVDGVPQKARDVRRA